VDAAWTSDATKLILCSTDGYVTIVEFEEGELGGVPDWDSVEKESTKEIVDEQIDEEEIDNSELVTKRGDSIEIPPPSDLILPQNSSSKRRITPTVI
jgi:hypothetical protein